MAWKTLTDRGNSDSVVLAVDFDITGRPEARFSDLVANLEPALRVWETVPPPLEVSSGDGYVEHWAQRLEQERPQVRAVLGFCAGSVYAAALAERISSWQGDEPLLVLFDPELSTAQTLLWQFHKITGFMASMLPPGEIDEARRIGQRAYEETPDVGALKDALIKLVGDFGHRALAKIGLDERRRDELFEVFSTFLTYLAAAGDIDPRERWRSAVAFNSSTPLSGLDAMRTAGVEVLVAREINCDVDHGTMLADKDLAARLSGLLTA
ncbi:hypothetical protein EDD27_1076 [Nonomuraea polychroma]|uniref:Thioesterase domain-containing protein n=1 Tax=Nonomuraea polychroma TaxID=46176 RepID=A0A438LZ38_9ACTN|nr:hypothetical protein [Nonomuraea polychroma]RVX38752.1 hypothetical protein EDD27_1076 [Nonomuraea polychroma]